MAFVFVFYFFHLKPGKDLDALAAGWKRGEIGMVVGVSDGNPEEDKEGFSSKEDEEFYNNLIDEYGDMLLPENPEEGIYYAGIWQELGLAESEDCTKWARSIVL